MFRNLTHGGLALVGGAVTGIAISSWATPTNPPQVASEVARVVSAAQPSALAPRASSRASGEAYDCSPWDVSDVAMEAALKEMIRRGWRPPSQAEIVASYDSYGGVGVQPVEPDSLVPARQPAAAASSPDEANSETAFPIDQIQPTSEPPLDTQPPVVGPPAPPAAVIGEEPTPPSH